MSGARAVTLAPASLPVLFLAIDDVICMTSNCGGFDALAAVKGRHANPDRVYRALFDAGATGALKQVYDQMEARLRYVVSSAWRELFGREQLDLVFRRAGLGFVADHLHKADRWCTPPKLGRNRRVDEIAEWLDRHHQGEPFAIVDDTGSGASLALAVGLTLAPALTVMPPPLASSNVPAVRHSRKEAPHPFAGRVTLCDENVGLTREHVPFIVAALRRPVSMTSVPA